MRCLVLVSALLVASSAFLFHSGDKKWNDLKVKWGPNLISKNFYVSQPRTATEAEEQGFKKISDCDVNAKWRGAQYVKDDDFSMVLLYDVNGYIAGIQTTVPKEGGNYPNSDIQPPFIDNGDHWLITAYFVRPDIICTSGRNAADFENEGTGTNLYIQDNTVPEGSTLIPRQESDIGSTMWTKGKCFYTMGQHYWYNLSDDMDCNKFYPVFLLYNGGVLNGFGWALMAGLKADRWEHPTPRSIPLFMESVPKCIPEYFSTGGELSTLHIYMTSRITSTLC